MNKFITRILCMLCIVGITSCNDEIDAPSGNIEGEDSFVGTHKSIEIAEGLHDFEESPFTCYIKAPDGSIIKREGEVVKNEKVATIYMDQGLTDGTYHILYLEYDLAKPTSEKHKKAHYGLGCAVKIENGRSTLLSKYNSKMKMYGSGTKGDEFIISSYSHLIDLTFAIEDGDEEAINANYRQIIDIDMDYASYRCDSNFGWMPIGTASNPFRGTYVGASDGEIHTISNIWATTRDMNGVGFFGYLLDAKIDSLNITNAKMMGDAAVGVVAGVVLQSGDERVSTTISNCTVSNSVVSGFEELGHRNTMMMGGILGCVDLNSVAMVTSCTVDNTSISASVNAGGIVGGTGLYTCLSINDCKTTSSCSVTSDYSGAGGMVGSCDTLLINGCQNEAPIVGARLYSPSESGTAGFGVGGIVGGSTVSYITASINKGSVSGYTGVGGIIGSTRAAGAGTKSDPMMYNNTYLRYCGNEGAVNGNDNVGGLCGEAQFGCYGGYNTGNVTGKGNYVSGGVANTSLAVAHNTVNTGNISGQNFVSGVVSKTEFGSVAFSQNYGSVTAKSGSTHTGGVCAIATNYSVFHHSGNFGKVTGYGNVGGIVGELGHVDGIDGLTIASTVMVVADMTMAFFAGPIIGMAIEGTAGIVKRVIQTVNVGITMIFAGIDEGLAIYPWTQHYDEEEWDSLTTEISQTVDENIKTIEAKIETLRSDNGRKFALYEGLSAKTITDNYSEVMKEHHSYYTTGSNDSIINANINIKRDDLAAEVKDDMKTTSIIHTALSAIAVAAAAVFTTVATFATGGASTIFTALGMGATLFGSGVSVSSMICDTTENAVIVSQCVNGGDVVTPDADNLYRVGGIVGHLSDHGQVYDCLNTAGVKGGHLVGTAENKSKIHRCISVWKNSTPVSNTANLFYRAYGADYGDLLILDDNTYMPGDGCGTISMSDLTNGSVYPWNVGNGEKWHVPDGASFAIPYKSEMRE